MTSEKITTAELRKQNRNQVFRFIYDSKRTSKQEIAAKLSLSLPTVSQNLKELESMQLIERSGLYESSGGRKPQAIQCISRSRAAIGISASRNHIHMACIDLYGTVIKEIWYDLAYAADIDYCKRVGELLDIFIKSIRISSKKILGVGITLQGIVSADGQYISYGRILDNTGVRLDDFVQFIPYPCRLLHDAQAASIAELHYNPGITDTIYLAISDYIGSAVILDGAIYHGNTLGGGLMEHMVIDPNGIPCYCGKKGCFETCCSLQVLCGSYKNLPAFFSSLQNQDKEAQKRWKSYLDTLAAAIDNIHMIIDCPILIGGPLSAHITEADLQYLNDAALDKCIFEEKSPYIYSSQCHDSVDVIGSALTHVHDFIESI